MNTNTIKILLLGSLLFVAGCELTLKKKTKNEKESTAEINIPEKIIENKSSKVQMAELENVFNNTDKKLINLFYKDKANKKLLSDMLTHTRLTKKQAKQLAVSKHIDKDIQVVPLPLELERMLSPLTRNMLRVQAGKNVILMDVNSRRILDLIKL